MTGGAAPARLLAAGTMARLGYAGLRRTQPGGQDRWTRTNHRGEPVTLLAGPAVTAGAVAAAVAVPGLGGKERAALGLAGALSGAFGCYDDLTGSSQRRGLRGHLGALAAGEVTTGTVKIAGIGAAGLVAAVLLDCRDQPGRDQQGRGQPGRGRAARIADVGVNAGLIAGCANLLNLFDLRPGRAIKVALLGSAGLALAAPAARALAAAPAGAAVALLPEDLGEQAMLGDCGANAAGAMLGVAAAAGLGRPARLAAFAAVAGLTLASEKVSFTKVIARTAPLNWLDMLGRRPAAATGTGRGPGTAAGSGTAGESGPDAAARDAAPVGPRPHPPASTAPAP